MYGSSRTFYLQNNKNKEEDHEVFLVGFVATEIIKRKRNKGSYNFRGTSSMSKKQVRQQIINEQASSKEESIPPTNRKVHKQQSSTEINEVMLEI